MTLLTIAGSAHKYIPHTMRADLRLGKFCVCKNRITSISGKRPRQQRFLLDQQQLSSPGRDNSVFQFYPDCQGHICRRQDTSFGTDRQAMAVLGVAQPVNLEPGAQRHGIGVDQPADFDYPIGKHLRVIFNDIQRHHWFMR